MSTDEGPRPSIFNTHRRLLIVIAVIAILIALGAVTDGIAPMVALVLFFPIFIYWNFRRIRKESSHATSAEENEAQWKKYQSQRTQIIDEARQAYARGPFGKWRDAVVEYRSRANPIIHEERALLLLPDAPSAFHWRCLQPPLNVASVFHVKFQTEGNLLVQMESPAVPGWHQVSYTFQAHKNRMGIPQLTIEFDSPNPLPEDQQDAWPFQGQYFVQP